MTTPIDPEIPDDVVTIRVAADAMAYAALAAMPLTTATTSVDRAAARTASAASKAPTASPPGLSMSRTIDETEARARRRQPETSVLRRTSFRSMRRPSHPGSQENQ